MAVDMGSAQGSLTLNASAFFASVQSSIQEIRNLHDAAAQAASGVGTLESSLNGAGGAGAGLSGAMSNVSSVASSASTSISSISSTTQAASNNTQGFSNRLSSAWQAMRNAIPDAEELTKKLDAFGTKAVDVGKKLTKYVTTPLLGIGAYSLKTSMSFERAMSQVAATMGVSVEDIQDLTEAAKKMGEETQFTSVEAAQALNYLALAGYSSEQMIAALPNVLNLAAAGSMDLASASDMLTDGLSALNLTSRDSEVLMSNMETMVDQMARTASRSNTSVSQLGDAILTVGGTASYLSGGLTEVNQVIGLLSDRGIKASEAGTHLRNIILAMQPATADAEQAFLKVGLATQDAEGNFVNLAYNADGTMKSLQEIFGILQEGTATMTDMEKQQVLGDIFHRTDLASANALLGTSQERWSELADEIENAAGAGSQMATTQLNNLSGQLTLLKSKLDGIAITVGETLAPVLSSLLDKISSILERFKSLDPETQKAIVKFGLYAASIGPITTGLGKLSLGISSVIKVFQKLGLILASLKASSVFTAISSFLSKIPALASTALTKLSGLLSAGLKALLGPVTASIGTVLSGIGSFLAGYGIGSLIYNILGDEIDEVLHPIFDWFVEGWDVLVDFFSTAVPETVEMYLDYIVDFARGVVSVAQNILQSIRNFFSSIWTGITNLWSNITEFLSGIASWINTNVISPIASVIVPIIQKIQEINAKIWEILVALWQHLIVPWFRDTIIQPIVNFVRSAVDFVSQTLQNLWNGIVGIYSAVVSWVQEVIIDPVVQAIDWLVETVTQFAETLWQGIVDIYTAVSTWVVNNIIQPVSQVVGSLFSAIANFARNAWTSIVNVFRGVGTWFRDRFDEAYKGIQGVFNSIVSWLRELWQDIQSVFSSAATTVSQAFENAFTTAFNSVMSGVEGIVNFFVDSINGVIDIINDIPGVDIDKLTGLSLPRLSVGLDYVPYDDYQALLHKGERVLTKEENEAYTEGNVGRGDVFIFNSPSPIDERQAAKEFKRVKQDLAGGF